MKDIFIVTIRNRLKKGKLLVEGKCTWSSICSDSQGQYHSALMDQAGIDRIRAYDIEISRIEKVTYATLVALGLIKADEG